MKAWCLALVLLVAINASAAWLINNSPVMANVTPNIKTEDMSAYMRVYGTLLDGSSHIILGFDGVFAQALHVDLSNGDSTLITMTNDAPGPNGITRLPVALTLSNKFILTASANILSGVWEYDPVLKTSTRVGTNTDKIVVSICRAPDGVIFMGTFGTARIDYYNPSNGAFGTMGFADDDLVGVGNHAYYVSADLTHVYTTVRGGTPEWYLSVLDRATLTKTFFWKGDTPTALTVYDGVNGGVYADVITNGLHGYFRLTNGGLVSMTALAFAAVPKLDPTYDEPGVDSDLDNWNTQTGWEFEITATAYSVTGGISSASIRWKETNSSTWQSMTHTNGWLPVTATFDIIQPWNGGELIAITHGYGAVFAFTPGGSVEVLGDYKGQSTREVFKVSGTEVYIAGYHANTLRWNPSAPWTLTPSANDLASPSINPYRNDEGGGKYHSMMARGSNGKIYTASRWERNGVGGSLGQYNPADGALATIRLDNANDTPTDLKPAVSATKLVWSSYGDGEIRVFDAATFTQDTSYTLGVGMIQKMVEYESGKMFGISGSNICAWMVPDGTLIYSNNLPAAPYSITAQTTDFERITLGPDTFVYPTAAGKLYRVNPRTGTSTQLMTTTNNYKVSFKGLDAYLYGGATIWKIAGLLTNQPDTVARGITFRGVLQ